MGYNKHELSTINMLYSLKTICYITPLLPMTATSPQRPLSSVPKVVIVERVDCGAQVSNRPHILWVRRDNPRGMLGEYEKSL